MSDLQKAAVNTFAGLQLFQGHAKRASSNFLDIHDKNNGELE